MRPHGENGKGGAGEQAQTLALMALGWTLSDGARADRLLALTGLDSQALRDGLDNGAVLGAVLGFLADHEPDLIVCAAELGVDPADLIAARRALGA
ncbi:hypothetical protein GGR44_003309 [Sphingobium fontiphilum]|uniref:DUF3572 family protein n=1 Tax=Sphingobium fontiphilum TaxID=944425 RepID=A0A7W6GQJ7_9SPHN|nr:DUF3572 domain-containing protein [Sphingobium fontiphilum]MBB3983613.1 hypothetical protein [Sphingobium fontiphilum]